MGHRLRWLLISLAVVQALAILLHAGLIPEGRWQLDEYALVVNLRRSGWSSLEHRLLYSPRPFSELLLALYGRAVLALHRPLITPFLAIMWSGLLICLSAAVRASLPAGRDRALATVVVSTAIAAHWLTAYPIGDMFFWPVAAAAYLPVLAAASILCFLADGRTRRSDLTRGTALGLAALTSEIGAALAIVYAVLAFAMGCARRERPTVRLWWLIPAILGLGVMVALLSYRAGVPEPIAPGGVDTGRFGASLSTSSLELLREIGGTGLDSLTRISLALGAAGLLGMAGLRPGSRRALAVASSLLGAAFFSLFAACYHYGGICCERQHTLRDCFLDLIFLICALSVLPRTGIRRWAVAWVLLLAISSLTLVARRHGLEKSYAILDLALDSRSRTWASGSKPNSTRMVFYRSPDTPGEIVPGVGIPLGLYRTDGPGPLELNAMGQFFGKRQVRVCDPWQDRRAWLVNGVLIPACPDP